ncbi:MAG: hypothetical protein WCI51_14270 [Lentisphaerota bacterium]
MSIKVYEKVIAELETLRIEELAEADGDPARVAIAEQRHAEAVKIAKSLQAVITEISGRGIASDDEFNAMMVAEGIIKRVEQLHSEQTDNAAAIKPSWETVEKTVIGVGIGYLLIWVSSYFVKKLF